MSEPADTEDAWTSLHRQIAERLAPAGVGVDAYLAFHPHMTSYDDNRVPLPSGTIDAAQFLDTVRDLEAKLVPGALADEGRGRFRLITDRERAMYQQQLHQTIAGTPDTAVFLDAERFRAAMGPLLRARVALRLARLRERAQAAVAARMEPPPSSSSSPSPPSSSPPPPSSPPPSSPPSSSPRPSPPRPSPPPSPSRPWGMHARCRHRGHRPRRPRHGRHRCRRAAAGRRARRTQPPDAIYPLAVGS